MSTQPQEPRQEWADDGRCCEGYRCNDCPGYDAPATPVAQDPPAPDDSWRARGGIYDEPKVSAQKPPAPQSNAEWRAKVEELSPAALDACLCHDGEPCSVHPAPGGAQEPADRPHQWTKADVDALLAIPEMRDRKSVV